MEGKYKEPSDMMQKAFRLWAEEVNQRGGLIGRPLKLLFYNDKSDQDLTRKLYRKLIEQDKVDLVFSPYSTPLTLAASDITEMHEKLMLAVAAASGKPWQRNCRFLFQIYAPADRQFIGVMDMMARKNLKSLSLLYDETSDFNLDIIKGVKEWAARLKIDITYESGYQDSKKQLPELLKAVKALNPKGLVHSAYPPDSYELLRLLDAMQYKPMVLAMPIVPAHPRFQEKVGDIADGILGPSQWEPNERIPFPGSQRFVRDFNDFAGHLPSFHAASAYSACQLYEQAIIHTGSLSDDKLRSYIATLDTATVLGRFKVDASGQQIGHNSFIVQWQNGKKEIVWPDSMQTSRPEFQAFE
jgi:branched-chain amino acid transport system substrate-binding protein